MFLQLRVADHHIEKASTSPYSHKDTYFSSEPSLLFDNSTDLLKPVKDGSRHYPTGSSIVVDRVPSYKVDKSHSNHDSVRFNVDGHVSYPDVYNRKISRLGKYFCM